MTAGIEDELNSATGIDLTTLSHLQERLYKEIKVKAYSHMKCHSI